MWFFMTNPGRFRAKLYLHPDENDVGFHIESLKTTKNPKISWNVSLFINQMHERKWVFSLVRMIGNVRKKRAKKVYRMKNEKNLVQLAAPFVIRYARKRIQAAKNKGIFNK